MKTITSKLGLTAFSLILLFLLTSSFNKQTSTNNKYLTMKTFESVVGRGSRIMIVYEDGKTEVTELDKFNVDDMMQNVIKINTAINGISNKGYELVSSTGSDHAYIYTFVKK